MSFENRNARLVRNENNEEHIFTITCPIVFVFRLLDDLKIKKIVS